MVSDWKRVGGNTLERKMAPESVEDLMKIAVPSGLLAGLIMGVIARVSMRVFALADGMTPKFSIGGTAAVIFIFAVILGVPFALLYVRFWPSINLAGARHGLTYGVVLFLILIAIPFMIIPSDEGDLRTRLIAIATFLPVPLIYGFALGQLAESLINKV